MKAAVHDTYGPPDVVRIEEIDKPVPKAGDVLVEVRAASVNRADLDTLYARWKFLRLFLGVRRPRNRRLGADVAGVVESVGSDVTRFKPGDRVFGDLYSSTQDAFSEFVAAPEKALALIPDEMSFEDAATLPHSGILALQGLRRRNGSTFGAGARVLIVGASGSVGPFAVQIAKSRGAHVTGVASEAKLDFVRSLGADEVVGYATPDYRKTLGRYDWIVDVNAHDSVLSWRGLVKPGGVYAALGGDSAAWFAKVLVQGPAVSLATRKHMGLMLHWKPFNLDDVEELKRLTKTGEMRTIIDRRFALTEIVDALRYFDDGHARGKVIITF
ncbi:MAG TPA: NAD(P)-dependent alcohol dehydrogenase [Candidatus Limnocylindrales bacterium]|nr:NAD(P)-dependent alcohol dehydrogenase [Candidatus Limnocylindrales bacterium]